jgi:hypothetical protein
MKRLQGTNTLTYYETCVDYNRKKYNNIGHKGQRG